MNAYFGVGVSCSPAMVKKEQHYRHTLTGIQLALEAQGLGFDKTFDKPKRLLFDFESKLFEAIAILNRNFGPEPSLQFQEFHKKLRASLKCQDYQQALCVENHDDEVQKNLDLLHSLCMAFFTGINIHDFSSRLVRELRGDLEGDQELKNFPIVNLENHFSACHEALEAKVAEFRERGPSYWLRYVKDQINLGFDAFAQGNMPHVLYDVHLEDASGQERKISNLRFGTPTCEDFSSILLGEAEINFEFRGYLEACRKKGLRHLYVNLQNREPKLLWKNESPRSRALEFLQEQYPDVLTVISLSKDSDFYHQINDCEDIKEMKFFKSRLWDQLFSDDDSGSFFPKSLLENRYFDLSSDVEAIIEKVHTDIFNSRAQLDVNFRRDFIEIFYIYLVDYLMTKLSINNFNLTCKDCIDRGGGMSALLYVYYQIRSAHYQGNIDCERLESITFAPALLVRQREIKKERLDRFLSAVNCFIASPQILESLKIHQFDTFLVKNLEG